MLDETDSQYFSLETMKNKRRGQSPSPQITVGETVRRLLSGIPADKLNIELKENRLTLSNMHIKTWKRVAKDITKSLDEANIKYVLIKTLTVPYAYMDDVDLLIENEDEISEAQGILSKKGYSLYRDRYSLNSLKTSAIPHQKGIQVDIYPEPTWFNMKYAPKFFITSNRIKRKVLDFEAYTPTPTLEFYIIITHSYNHGFISLAEAAHVVRLISANEMDWNLIQRLTNAFKLDHALLLFLRIVQLSLSQGEDSKITDKLINEIVRKDTLSKFYSQWFDRASLTGFPLRLPLTLRMLSASARLFRPSLSSYTRVYDELIGYTLALLFRSDRRELISQ